MFRVQKRMCATCIFRPDRHLVPLSIAILIEHVHIDFQTLDPQR